MAVFNKILIISPDSLWVGLGLQNLKANGFDCESVGNGKEAQVLAHKNSYNYVFLDVLITNYSVLEVLKYLRSASPQSKVLITTKNEEELKQLDLSEKGLLKLGATKVIMGAVPAKLADVVKGLGRVQAWKDVEEFKGTGAEETEIKMSDDKFNKVLISDFFQDAMAVFDCYIKLGNDLLHKGHSQR